MGSSSYAPGSGLTENSAEDTIVLTSQSQVGYYSKRPWTYPPGLSDQAKWSTMSDKRVLLVVDDRRFFEKNREWREARERVVQLLSAPIYEDVETGPDLRIYEIGPDAHRSNHRSGT